MMNIGVALFANCSFRVELRLLFVYGRASPDHSARSDSTRLNWQLSWVESDRQSDHSARRATITLTTEKNWSRSTSKSFPPVAQFWSCSEFPRLSWVELGRIGRYDHAKKLNDWVVTHFSAQNNPPTYFAAQNYARYQIIHPSSTAGNDCLQKMSGATGLQLQVPLNKNYRLMYTHNSGHGLSLLYVLPYEF